MTSPFNKQTNTKYKQLIKKKIKESAFEYLKIRDIQYEQLETQKYMAEWADNYHDISYHDKSALSYCLDHW